MKFHLLSNNFFQRIKFLKLLEIPSHFFFYFLLLFVIPFAATLVFFNEGCLRLQEANDKLRVICHALIKSSDNKSEVVDSLEQEVENFYQEIPSLKKEKVKRLNDEHLSRPLEKAFLNLELERLSKKEASGELEKPLLSALDYRVEIPTLLSADSAQEVLKKIDHLCHIETKKEKLFLKKFHIKKTGSTNEFETFEIDFTLTKKEIGE